MFLVGRRDMSHEVSEFNTGTEIFASWILVLCLLGFVAGTFYFTIIRMPAKPVFERLFALLAVPGSVQKKIDLTITYVKSESVKQFEKSKQLVEQYLHKDMKPLKSEQKEVVNQLRGVSEDMGAAIIGAPLEDDPSAPPSPDRLVDI